MPRTGRSSGRSRERCSRSFVRWPRRASGRRIAASRAHDLLAVVLARGEDALARTPEMLDVLRERRRRRRGWRRSRRDRARTRLRRVGRGAPGSARRDGGAEPRRDSPGALRVPLLHGVRGRRGRARPGGLESTLERMGDSLLVVGDESALKVHVHTDDPGRRSRSATRSVSSRASRSRTCTIRPLSGKIVCSRGAPTRAPDARDRARRRLPRAWEPSPVREPWRDARHRGRPVDEPVCSGDHRRDRRGSRRRGDRPAEQLERRPHRRAGCAAYREDGPSRPVAVGAGRARSDG